MVSTRPDLLPPVYINQLELLQDQVPPEDFNQIKSGLETELGQPLTKIFSEINPIPLATASIGQVHEGYLTTGEHVVIKVQRSGVRQTVETDLEILADIAGFIEDRTEWGRVYRIQQIVDEFARSLREELDYTVEAANCDRLRNNSAKNPEVHIPRVFWDYSTPRMLVMEYIEGIKISIVPALEEAGIDIANVARLVTGIFLKQLLIDGFFHADLHPGNIAVSRDGTIILMDFGMMGFLDDWTRERLSYLIIQMINRNNDGILRILTEIGSVPPRAEKRHLRSEIARLMDRYFKQSLNRIQIAKPLQELLELSFTHHLQVPREFTLVIRSLILLESMIERLNPRTSLLELATPFGQQILKERFKPRHLARSTYKYLEDLSFILSKIPEDIHQLLKTTETGELRILLEHQNLNAMMNRLNIIGNRLAFSLIIAAIIIGSSLMALEKPSKSVFGQFPMAEAGFIIAVLMGVWLLIAMIRSGKI
jgi:ubiquinone biosynthesis protein